MSLRQSCDRLNRRPRWRHLLALSASGRLPGRLENGSSSFAPSLADQRHPQGLVVRSLAGIQSSVVGVGVAARRCQVTPPRASASTRAIAYLDRASVLAMIRASKALRASAGKRQ